MTLLAGCDRAPAPPPAPPPAASHAAPTVASLVPAATDLIVGMGAADHLVAVSNFCPPRSQTANLPRVGDYRTVDWEKLAELRPAVMITQFNPDKMPDGLREKAAAYGIRLVNVRIVRLNDVFAALASLGKEIDEPAKAQAAGDALRTELDAVAARVAGRPPVRTLISRTGDPLEAVGGGNFLDDLLAIAGGKNVLSGPGYDDNSFPTLDREQVLALNPDAVLNLLPAGPPQVVEQARTFWAGFANVSAVRAGRAAYLTDDDLLLPGLNVGKTAARFAESLHPPTPASSGPLSRYAGGGLGRGLERQATLSALSRRCLSVPAKTRVGWDFEAHPGLRGYAQTPACIAKVALTDVRPPPQPSPGVTGEGAIPILPLPAIAGAN